VVVGGHYCCVVALLIDVPSLFYCCSPFLPHKQLPAVAVGVGVVVVVSLGMGLSFQCCHVIGIWLDALDY
jgi:hypothetical protein